MARRTATLLLHFTLFLLASIPAPAQSPTTGRVTGTVKDQNGAVIVGAEVSVKSNATGYKQIVTTNESGTYAASLLLPGAYQIRVAAIGFTTAHIDTVQVVITESKVVNVNLAPAGVIGSVTVRIDPLVQGDGPQLGRVVDARTVSNLPLATRRRESKRHPGQPALLRTESFGDCAQHLGCRRVRVVENERPSLVAAFAKP